MWYLLVIRAHPDYKRPYSSTSIKFFRTKSLAEAAQRDAYEKFFEEYDEIFNDEEGRWRSGLSREETIEKIDARHYIDAYMDMVPFSAVVDKVVAEESGATNGMNFID